MPERGTDGADEARAVDALDAYWDDLIDDANGAAPPPRLDPELGAAVRLVRGLPAVPPDSAFVARLEEELLMNMPATPIGPRPAAATIGPATGAATNGRWSVPTPVAPPPSRRRVWGRAVEAVAAAALLLAILGGLVAGWGLRPERAEQSPTGAPGIAQATPPAADDDGTAMYLGNAGRTGEVPGPGPAGEPERRWSVPIAEGEEGDFWSTPRVVGGTAYLAGRLFGGADERRTEAGVVVALDPATGAERWRAEVMAPAPFDPAAPASVHVGEPAVADGGLFVDVTVERQLGGPAPDPVVIDDSSAVVQAAEVETASTIVALDAATGAERWRVATGESSGLPPAVRDGVVFGGAGDGALLALDAATGAERWRATVATDARNLEQGIWLSRPAVGDGAVYVTDNADSLLAFDAATGAERWRFTPQSENAGLTDPVVADGLVYVASHTSNDGTPDDIPGRLHALDAATGAERWSYEGDPNIVASPLVGGGLVYVMKGYGQEAELVALDAASGRERWSFTPEGFIDYLPVLADGALYVMTREPGGSLFGRIGVLLGIEDDSFLHAVDAVSGEQRWRTDVETVNGPTAFGVAGGIVYRLEGRDDGGNGPALTAYGDD